MGEITKKGICCDYCQADSSIGQIYTVKKHFAGKRVLDILQVVTKRVIPVSAPIKICSLCMSTLLSTVVIVEKATTLVDKFIEDNPTAKKKGSAKKTNTTNELTSTSTCDEDKVFTNNTKEPVNSLSAKSPKTCQLMKKEEASPLKTDVKMAATKSPFSCISNTHLQEAEVSKSSSPKKKQTNTPRKLKSPQPDEIDNLKDAVKLTPSQAISSKNRAFIQLFGPRDEANDEATENEEDDDCATKKEAETQMKKFECKLCDFAVNKAYLYKDHLKVKHEQKRPRVFECTVCPKTFGVRKSLKIHLESHGIIVPESHKTENKKSSFRKSESIPKAKLFENVQSTEYTFALNDNKTSTPKPKIVRNRLEFQCDVCDSELKTLKSMQDHMKDFHNIYDPKLFQCEECSLRYKTKQNLIRHIKDVHKILNPNVNQNKRNLTDDASSDEAASLSVNIPVEAVKIMTANQPATPKLNTEIGNKTNVEIDSSKVNEKMDMNSSKVNGETNKNISNEENKIAKLRRKTISENQFLTPLAIEIKSPESLRFTPLNANKRKSIDSISESADNKLRKLIQEATKPNSNKSFENELVSKNFSSPDIDGSGSTYKHGNKYPPVSAIIDIIDEINLDLKPHKRELLYSDQDESAFSCSQCGKKAATRKRLDSHVRKKHTSFQCPACGERYASSDDFVGHFTKSCSNATEGLPCGAKKCTKVFQSSEYLLSHIMKKHPCE